MNESIITTAIHKLIENGMEQDKIYYKRTNEQQMMLTPLGALTISALLIDIANNLIKKTLE